MKHNTILTKCIHKNKIDTASNLKSLFEENNNIDIWRDVHKNIQRFTWRRKDKYQASRIFLILNSSNFKPSIYICKIKLATFKYTDHFSIKKGEVIYCQ